MSARPSAAGRKSSPQPRKPAQRRAPLSRKVPARRVPAGYIPLVVLACIVVVGWQLYPVAKVHYKQQRDLGRLERQLADIRARNKTLKSEVDKLRTKEGVEDAARDLGLAHKGEQRYVVVDGRTASTGGPTAPAVGVASTVEDDAWTQFLDAIFGVTP